MLRDDTLTLHIRQINSSFAIFSGKVLGLEFYSNSQGVYNQSSDNKVQCEVFLSFEKVRNHSQTELRQLRASTFLPWAVATKAWYQEKMVQHQHLLRICRVLTWIPAMSYLAFIGLTPMSWPGSEKHILENICCVSLFLPKHLKIPKRTASFQDPFILSGNL